MLNVKSEQAMIKVKTFTTEIKILKTMRELRELDEQVNRFLQKNNVKKVISVSDTCTSGEKGMTIGLIRVVAYET